MLSYLVAILVGNVVAIRAVSAATDEVINCYRCSYPSLPGRTFLQCHYDRRTMCSAESYVVQLADHGGEEFQGSADGNDVTDAVHTRCRSTNWPSRRMSGRPDTGGVTASSTSASAALPASCFDPTGTGCDWYRDCLETDYPCSDSEYGYAMEFGDKYCRLFVENTKSFSLVGRRWLDFVRKCLQVALVDPVLRAKVRPTCRDIRRIAFESHIPCYLPSLPGEPSACDIELSDWIALAWTLRSTITHPSIGVEVIKSALRVFYGCLIRQIHL